MSSLTVAYEQLLMTSHTISWRHLRHILRYLKGKIPSHHCLTSGMFGASAVHCIRASDTEVWCKAVSLIITRVNSYGFRHLRGCNSESLTWSEMWLLSTFTLDLFWHNVGWCWGGGGGMTFMHNNSFDSDIAGLRTPPPPFLGNIVLWRHFMMSWTSQNVHLQIGTNFRKL